MNKVSNNILTLMRSDAYLNSNNPNHAAVAKQVQDYFENKVDIFMDDLKGNRLEYLQRLPDWEKYGDGWANRTNTY